VVIAGFLIVNAGFQPIRSWLNIKKGKEERNMGMEIAEIKERIDKPDSLWRVWHLVDPDEPYSVYDLSIDDLIKRYPTAAVMLAECHGIELEVIGKKHIRIARIEI